MNPTLLRSACALLLCWMTALAGDAHALTLRAQTIQRGDFVLIGNTLAQDCALGVSVPITGNVGPCGANTADTAPDVFWRADSPATGNAEANTAITAAQARTTSVLTLPAGAVVTHAWLYWAASKVSGTGPSVQLDLPGGGSQTITALPGDIVVSGGTRYRAAADVTALVRARGAGAYRFSGVDADALLNINDGNRFAAWWMVVLYELSSEPVRSLALYDGFEAVTTGAPANTTLSGFLVPASVGTAKLGLAALEGDDTISGDRLLVNGTAVSNALNPADNFFNSTRSHLGAAVSTAGDLPRLAGTANSMSGLDLDIVDIAPMLSAGDTTAQVEMETSGDAFLAATLVSAVETAQPLLAGTVSMSDLNAGALMPGDTVELTVTVRNEGESAASGVVASEVLPAGLSYVPGSLVFAAGPNAGAKTDSAGDDDADFDTATRRWTVRLGLGANATQGGVLAAAEAVTVRLRARVDALCSGDRTFNTQPLITASNANDALADGNAALPGPQPAALSLSVRCLTTSVSGPGTVSGASGPVATGASVTLTANPHAGAFFQQWSGDASGSVNPLSLAIHTDLNVMGQFAAKAAQVITGFEATPAVPPYSVGGTFTVGATGGGSGLPVVFSSKTPAVCTVAGAVVTMHTAGACTLVASQAGDAQFQSAPSVTLTLYLGVPPPAAQPIPTLGWWSLMLLAGLLPMVGRRALARR